MRMVVNNKIGVELPRKKSSEGNSPPSVNVLSSLYGEQDRFTTTSCSSTGRCTLAFVHAGLGGIHVCGDGTMILSHRRCQSPGVVSGCANGAECVPRIL